MQAHYHIYVGGQRVTFGSQFSRLSVLSMELRSSGLHTCFYPLSPLAVLLNLVLLLKWPLAAAALEEICGHDSHGQDEEK